MAGHVLWWLLEGNRSSGPFDFEAVATRLQNGTLSPETLACPAGGQEWRALRDWKVFPLPPQATSSPAAPGLPFTITPRTKRKDASWESAVSWLVVPGIVVAIVGIRCAGNSFFADPQQQALAELRAAAVRDFNASKQIIFNHFHPIGTATSVEVHDVSFITGPGGETLVLYRFTLHWEGPITKDGFTKAQLTFDPESQAIVGSTILATNGTTNAEAQQMAFDFGRLLGEAVRQEQERRRQDEFLRRLHGS